MRHKLVLAVTAVGLTSCGTYTPAQVAEPSNITLQQAVFDVADTLRDVQGRVPFHQRSGLLVDEVTVVFNVAADSTTTSKGNLTISNVPLAGGALGGGLESQNVSNGTRGNTVTIKFKNVATADMSKSNMKPRRQCRDGERTPDCVATTFQKPRERQ